MGENSQAQNDGTRMPYVAERVTAAVDLLASLLRHSVKKFIVVVGVHELKRPT
jgi:hypothetical protein